jgi:zinc protease
MSRALRRTLVLVVVAVVSAGWDARAQVRTIDQLTYPPLPSFELPKPERTVLPNGMVVLVMENHDLPLVSVTARIRTGSLLEPADRTGLASLTGSVLRAGGTEALSPDQLDTFLEDRAASIETGIGDDAGTAGMSVLTDDFRDVLRVFADVLRRPRFDEARVQLARRNVEAGIARQNDDAGAIAAREYRRVIYGAESPFARRVTYDSIGGITRDDLVAWHRDHFHPNRIILAVHGDIAAADAVAAIREAFGDWARGPEDPVIFPEPSPSSPTGVFEAVKDDVEQSSIRIGHQGSLVSTHPDYYPVQILNEVLSGGFTSRLFSRVRTEKGLAYSVGGSVGSQFTRVAPVSLATSTKTSTTVEAIETLVSEARRIISEPPTDTEIARARQSILNSFIFNSATTQQVLGQQLTYEYHGVPADWLERYRAGIEAVTREDVAAVAERYIHPDRFAILVVGPEAGRDGSLDTLGPVTRLDITIPEPASTGPAPTAGAQGTPTGSAGGDREAGGPTPEATAEGEALLARAVETLGGFERISAISAYREVFTAVVQTPQGEMTLESTATVALPDRIRQDIVTPMGELALVVSPERGIVVLPGGVRQAMPTAQRDEIAQQLQRSPMVFLRSPGGITAQHVGEDEVGGKRVRRVQVSSGSIRSVLGIDPATGHIRSLSYRGTSPTGAPADMVTEFDDYRSVGGLLVAHQRQTRVDGQVVQTVTVTSAEVNPELDPAIFR